MRQLKMKETGCGITKLRESGDKVMTKGGTKKVMEISIQLGPLAGPDPPSTSMITGIQ